MIIKDLNHNSLLKENSKLDLEALNLGSFPKRKEERWKYTPLRSLKKINFHNQFNFKIEIEIFPHFSEKKSLFPIQKG